MDRRELYFHKCLTDNFYALNPDGTPKWIYTADNFFSSPTIAEDGTIYCGSNDDSLYAFNPDGTAKWTFATGSNVVAGPAIGLDGTVYAGSNDDYRSSLGHFERPPMAHQVAHGQLLPRSIEGQDHIVPTRPDRQHITVAAGEPVGHHSGAEVHLAA